MTAAVNWDRGTEIQVPLIPPVKEGIKRRSKRRETGSP